MKLTFGPGIESVSRGREERRGMTRGGDDSRLPLMPSTYERQRANNHENNVAKNKCIKRKLADGENKNVFAAAKCKCLAMAA